MTTNVVVTDVVPYGVVSDQFPYFAGRPWYTVIGDPVAYFPSVRNE